jgi:hypothetical protein
MNTIRANEANPTSQSDTVETILFRCPGMALDTCMPRFTDPPPQLPRCRQSTNQSVNPLFALE